MLCSSKRLFSERRESGLACIWIVEDEEKIGLLIEKTVCKAGHEALVLRDARELEARLKKGTPDLLLLDLMLRGKDGFAILTEWKRGRDTARVPVIILSARSAEQDKVRGLELGAEDYVTKPFGVRELQARIQTALRRTTPAARRVELGALALRPDTRETWVDGQSVALTYKEFEILLCLWRHDGQIVTRAQLLEEVWGYADSADTSRTVDYHVAQLRTKLGDDPANARFVQTVRGAGYRLIVP